MADALPGSDRPNASMRAFIFQAFVASLLSTQPGWEADEEVKVGDREVDVLARTSDGTNLIVEVKYVTPQTQRRLRNVVEQLVALRAAFEASRPGEAVKVVLAVPSVVHPALRGDLEAAGIEIYDPPVLRRLADLVDLGQAADEVLGPPLTAPPVMTDAPGEVLPQLDRIECGRPSWAEYQRAVKTLLAHLFCPPLSAPLFEDENWVGVNRRDIILPNYCPDGFWKFLAERYRADYIVVDAKNYCGAVGKQQVLQVANYLSLGGPGLFGMILTRNGIDASGEYIAREQWLMHGKLIITITDADLQQMLANKRSGDAPEEVVRQKIEDFRLAI